MEQTYIIRLHGFRRRAGASAPSASGPEQTTNATDPTVHHNGGQHRSASTAAHPGAGEPSNRAASSPFGRCLDVPTTTPPATAPATIDNLQRRGRPFDTPCWAFLPRFLGLPPLTPAPSRVCPATDDGLHQPTAPLSSFSPVNLRQTTTSSASPTSPKHRQRHRGRPPWPAPNMCPCNWKPRPASPQQPGTFFDFPLRLLRQTTADYNHDGFTNSQDFFRLPLLLFNPGRLRLLIDVSASTVALWRRSAKARWLIQSTQEPCARKRRAGFFLCFRTRGPRLSTFFTPDDERSLRSGIVRPSWCRTDWSQHPRETSMRSGNARPLRPKSDRTIAAK